MNPQTRPFSYPTVSPLPATAARPIASKLDSDSRWNQWAEKGVREQAAFKEKARVIAAIAGLAIALAAAAWGFVSF